MDRCRSGAPPLSGLFRFAVGSMGFANSGSAHGPALTVGGAAAAPAFHVHCWNMFCRVSGCGKHRRHRLARSSVPGSVATLLLAPRQTSFVTYHPGHTFTHAARPLVDPESAIAPGPNSLLGADCRRCVQASGNLAIQQSTNTQRTVAAGVRAGDEHVRRQEGPRQHAELLLLALPVLDLHHHIRVCGCHIQSKSKSSIAAMLCSYCSRQTNINTICCDPALQLSQRTHNTLRIASWRAQAVRPHLPEWMRWASSGAARGPG
jgi:hypothetical protein